MNKVCYTVLFGPYEDLKPINVITEGWEYCCVTDDATLNVPGWRIIYAKVMECGPQRTARYYKINFHKIFPTAEYTLYLDASFQINVNLDLFWQRHFKPPFTAPNHPIRNCVYREVASCVANKRGDKEDLLLIENQGAEYKKLKVPAFNGIITSGVLMRQNTEGCRKMCEQWWEELSKYSTRDQIAFANISRGWKFNTFQWDYSQSKELKHFKHYQYRH